MGPSFLSAQGNGENRMDQSLGTFEASRVDYLIPKS